MNIFSIDRKVRKLGINYGLVMWEVDCNFGISYKPDQAVLEMGKKGGGRGDWVYIVNGLKERGISTFVEGLKFIGFKVEMEASSLSGIPMWYPTIDTWTVFWEGEGTFNLKALRPRVDIAIFKGLSLQEITGFTKDCLCEKGLIVDNYENLDMENLLRTKVRLYKS